MMAPLESTSTCWFTGTWCTTFAPCKVTQEPLVILDAGAVLLCQSHWPCMSRERMEETSVTATPRSHLSSPLLLQGCDHPDCWLVRG